MAEIAEAGVGKKAVISAEHMLANAICANVANWYSEHYAAGFAYEIHSIRSDVRRLQESTWIVPVGVGGGSLGWSFGGPDLSAPHVRQMCPGSSCVATEWSPSVVTWRLEPAGESALRLARGEGRGPRAQGGPRPAVADLPSVFHGATAQGAEDVSLGLARRCTCRPELAGAIGRAEHCIARLPGHQQRRVAEQEAVREHHRVHFCRGVRGAGGVGGGRARRTLRPVPFAKSRYTAETLGEAPGRSGLRGGQTRHSDTCFWSWRDLWGMVTLRGSRAGTGGNVVVFRCSPPDSTPQSPGRQTSVDGGGKVRVVSPIVRRSCATSESPACSFCWGWGLPCRSAWRFGVGHGQASRQWRHGNSSIDIAWSSQTCSSCRTDAAAKASTPC